MTKNANAGRGDYSIITAECTLSIPTCDYVVFNLRYMYKS